MEGPSGTNPNSSLKPPTPPSKPLLLFEDFPAVPSCRRHLFFQMSMVIMVILTFLNAQDTCLGEKYNLFSLRNVSILSLSCFSSTIDLWGVVILSNFHKLGIELYNVGLIIENTNIALSYCMSCNVLRF